MDDERKVMDKAMRLLAVRAHSTAELREKLFSKGFSRNLVDFALSECVRLRFLDDRLFAESYLLELQGRGYGGRKCRVAMQRKGLAAELINELLDGGCRDDEAERAGELLKRKLKSLSRETDPRKRKEKALRFMVSRGFPIGMVLELYDRMD